jgi:hypothetical protein
MEGSMRRWTAAFLLLAACAVSGCRGKKHAQEGHGQPEAAVAAPTPDTTPIEALRTPAGLVLKTTGQTPVPATPSPGAAVTPEAPKAGS